MNDEDDAPAKKPNPLAPPDNTTRHVMPLGPRVLVRMIVSEDRSSGGLFLPPGAKDAVAKAAYGEVIEVARASGDDEDPLGTNVSGIPEGARVLFAKDVGVPIPWDETLRVVDMREQVIDVPPQEVITADNVSVAVDAVVYYEPTDPQRLIYNIANFIVAVTKLAQTNWRNVIGEMSLDGREC